MSFQHSFLVSVSLIGFSSGALAATAPDVSVAPPAVVAPAIAPAAPAMSGPITREQLPALVKEVLMNEPEIVMEAVKKLKEKQAEEAKQKAAEAMIKNKDALFNHPTSPSIGDPKTADVTLVEFYDYHCGYCRQLLPELMKLYKEDGKLHIVFKEFPILSEDSLAAARAALAVNRIAKDKYLDYHTALMTHEGKYDEKSLLEIGKKFGIDGAKLKAEMAKQEITAELDENRALAEALGIRGTPAIIIGDELTPGAMPYEQMKNSVQAVRAKKTGAAPAAPAVPAPPVPAKQ